MANDKDIKIGLQTVGADAAAKAIDKVEQSTKGLSEAAGRDAVRSMEDMTEKARVTEFAHYDLDAAVRKTDTSLGTFTAGQTQMQASTRNSSQALLMFSQGFEDAQYGIRGVLNNIPGLIIAMGGTAGLAGAISIAAVAGSVLVEKLGAVEEKASDVEDRIRDVANSMGELEADRFDEVGEAIDATRERAEALKQEFDDTRAAESAFSTAALDNSAKLALAQSNVAEALGQQVDHYRELQDIAAQEAAERKLAAEQAIEAEKQKVIAQEQASAAASAYLQEQLLRAKAEEENLATLRAQLGALREQKEELERIAKVAVKDLDSIGGGLAKMPTGDAMRQQFDAQQQLADPAFKAQLEGTQARVDQLEELVRNLTKDGGIVARAENAFLAAQGQLTDLTSAVATNIQSIEQTLAAEDLVARSSTLAATQEQQAKDLSAAVAQIETTTAAGLAAKASIEAAAADGRITANESATVAQATSQIIAQVQAGLATAGSNTQAVLGILRTVAAQEVKNAQDIATMKAQINQLFGRIR
jgi:hypothetical protein